MIWVEGDDSHGRTNLRKRVSCSCVLLYCDIDPSCVTAIGVQIW